MRQGARGPAITRLTLLSSLIADAVTRDAFLRAERDQGKAFAVSERQLAIVADRGATRDRRGSSDLHFHMWSW
jgi:hypothetical protein